MNEPTMTVIERDQATRKPTYHFDLTVEILSGLWWRHCVDRAAR